MHMQTTKIAIYQNVDIQTRWQGAASTTGVRTILAGVFGLGVLAAMLAGCGSVGSFIGGEELIAESSVGGGSLRAAGPTRVYRLTNAKSAMIYITDLPDEAFAPGADPAAFNGTIAQVHVLLTPEAGQTPIADQACNTAVRMMVVSGGEVGIYGGGAFSDADQDDLGQEEFGARVNGGTLRLIYSTPKFVDRLVHARFTGSARGTLDETKVARIERRFAWLSALTTPLDRVGYVPELEWFEKKISEEQGGGSPSADDATGTAGAKETEGK